MGQTFFSLSPTLLSNFQAIQIITKSLTMEIEDPFLSVFFEDVNNDLDLNVFLDEGYEEALLEEGGDIGASSSSSSILGKRRTSDEEVGDEAEGESAHKFPLIYVHEGKEYAFKQLCP